MKDRGIPLKVTNGVAATRLIDKLSIECPPHQILREGLHNAIEANNRHNDKRGSILITRDHEHTNKLSIINIGGEYFSEDKAKTHLNTLALSGNEGRQRVGMSDNFGIGAKVSYLPKAPLGIVYRSCSADESIEFNMKRLDNGCYGLSEMEFDDGTFGAFYEPNQLSPELVAHPHGTEMVLMGSTAEEDTYITLSGLVGEKTTGYSGTSLFHYLSLRQWEDMNNDIRVQGYRLQDVNDPTSPFVKDRTLKVRPLKEEMKDKCDDYGCVDLNVRGIGKVKAYYGRPRLTKHPELRRGDYDVTFAWRGECYHDFAHPNTKAARLRACGISTEERYWFVVFEIPNDCDKVHPNASRSRLVGVEPEIFYESFRRSLPKEIIQWLRNKHKQMVAADTTKAYVTKMLKKPVMGKMKLASSSSTKGTSGVKRRTPKRNLVWKVKHRVPPMMLKNDQDTEPTCLMRFDTVSYNLQVFTEHELFKQKVSVLEKEYPSVPFQTLVEVVYRVYLVGAMGWIFEMADLTNSQQQLENMYDERILSNSWSVYSGREARDTLKGLLKRVTV